MRSIAAVALVGVADALTSPRSPRRPPVLTSFAAPPSSRPSRLASLAAFVLRRPPALTSFAPEPEGITDILFEFLYDGSPKERRNQWMLKEKIKQADVHKEIVSYEGKTDFDISDEGTPLKSNIGLTANFRDQYSKRWFLMTATFGRVNPQGHVDLYTVVNPQQSLEYQKTLYEHINPKLYEMQPQPDGTPKIRLFDAYERVTEGDAEFPESRDFLRKIKLDSQTYWVVTKGIEERDRSKNALGFQEPVTLFKDVKLTLFTKKSPSGKGFYVRQVTIGKALRKIGHYDNIDMQAYAKVSDKMIIGYVTQTDTLIEASPTNYGQPPTERPAEGASCIGEAQSSLLKQSKSQFLSFN